MREIKFKVWLPYANIMMQPKDIQTIYESVINGVTIGQLKQWVYLQYTGLKDKNGKEIYEGDIVRYWGGVNEVVFINGRFCIRYTDLDFIDLSAARKEEVLGNVYENPELLKKSEVQS